jgi:hypothetical protein
MADVVSEEKVPVPARRETAPLAQRPPRPLPASRHRFGIAYLVLATLLGAAVGFFVVLVQQGGNSKGPAWSSWKPTQSGVQGRDQIAKQVAAEYALPSGRTLVGVLSTPPIVQGQSQAVPVRALAVSTGLPGESVNDFQFYDAGSAWAYVMCGLGSNCAISEGKPTIVRGQLLRREALELALYTFKYDNGVDSLVTFIPPQPGKQPKVALFFRRADLKSPLGKPLAETLQPTETRIQPGKMSPSDLAAVREFSDPRVYNFEFQQLADGTAIMVLKPPAF